MSVRHPQPSPLAGRTVEVGGEEFRVEDWADRVFGRSWAVMEGNPTALAYAVRLARAGLPLDDQVLYGKAGIFARLVHVSEIVGGEQP